MINYNSDGANYKHSSDHGQKVIEHGGAAGDVNNDQIKRCYICLDNGFPHEAITFHKVNGRVLSSGGGGGGGNEVKRLGNKGLLYGQKARA